MWVLIILIWLWLTPLALFFIKGTFKCCTGFWHFIALCLIFSIPLYNWSLLNKVTVCVGDYKETNRPKY